MNWKPIDDVPHDKLVLLRKNFEKAETPLIVIGEVFKFKGNIHHTWRGGYDDSIKLYKKVDPKWDEKFDFYAEID
jgi:hypothetical protein